MKLKSMSTDDFLKWCGNHRVKGCGKTRTMCDIECRPRAQLDCNQKQVDELATEVLEKAKE